MKVTWQDIPSADTAPADAASTTIRYELKRRTVVRSVAALGMTLGVTVLGWVAPGTSRRAEARVGSEWGNCNIFSYDNALCVGGPYSQDYCGSDGWFRDGYALGYRWVPLVSCNGRNAWIWDSGSVGWRCADGMRYPQAGGSGEKVLCAYPAYRH